MAQWLVRLLSLYQSHYFSHALHYLPVAFVDVYPHLRDKRVCDRKLGKGIARNRELAYTNDSDSELRERKMVS
ncbi:MAG TPA: hypothetical protein VK452_04905 [Dissulfurispiraceae bacterium]|nr:hypothetical protein [Dissulfurispiraceae bacterium]